MASFMSSVSGSWGEQVSRQKHKNFANGKNPKNFRLTSMSHFPDEAQKGAMICEKSCCYK